MADIVDKRIFEELAKRDPKEIVMPPFCDYSETEECYTVSAWGGKYEVKPHSAGLRAIEGSTEPHPYFYIFLVNYLLAGKIEKPQGDWISEKDLVGGVTFFRGPHTIPTHFITERFGDDLDSLQKECEKLGGAALDMADCSYQFNIIGSVHISLLYWQGDEDFPADAKLLMDKSVAGTLPLDVVYSLLCAICFRIGKASF